MRLGGGRLPNSFTHTDGKETASIPECIMYLIYMQVICIFFKIDFLGIRDTISSTQAILKVVTFLTCYFLHSSSFRQKARDYSEERCCTDASRAQSEAI